MIFYQSLEVLAKFGPVMLWGIQFSYLCIIDSIAGGSFISNVQMNIRVLIFQSINDSFFCFSRFPWTWRTTAGGCTTGSSWWPTGSGSSKCRSVFSRYCLRNLCKAAVSTSLLIINDEVGEALLLTVAAGEGDCWRMAPPPVSLVRITFTFIVCDLTETSVRSRQMVKLVDSGHGVMAFWNLWPWMVLVPGSSLPEERRSSQDLSSFFFLPRQNFNFEVNATLLARTSLHA